VRLIYKQYWTRWPNPLPVSAKPMAIWRPDGGTLKMAATFGGSSKWIEYAKQNPLVPDRGTVSGRVLLDGKVIHVRDVLADLTDVRELAASAGALGAPTVRPRLSHAGAFFGAK
jgi:hypothetical protein